MRIVLNHLTRMKSPRICIAGVDPESGGHVRPVTGPDEPLTRRLLAESGGPLEVGAVIELGDVVPRPESPETEDHRFAPARARCDRLLADDEYLELLDRSSSTTVEAAFGTELQRHDWKYAVDAGEGSRSLACVLAQRPPRLEIDSRFGKLQLRFNDPEKPAFLTVTDLRFVEADHRTPREDVIADVQTRIARGVPVRIMFGLARSFLAAGDDQKRHWLQVNGLCLEDRPVGRVP